MIFLLVNGACLLLIFSRASCLNCDVYDENGLHDKKLIHLTTAISLIHH